MRRYVPILVAAAILSGAVTLRAEEPPPIKVIPFAQARYTEGCGGCHGLLGTSARESIPVLRDQVGWFLCTPEGRDYVVRLPNVAFANMDDATLAETLNFMMFSFGGTSLPAGAEARPYTAAEVGRLRQAPLKGEPLLTMRTDILGKAMTGCETQPN